MHDVAKSFGLEAHNLSDDPIDIMSHCDTLFHYPTLLNINTHRLYWHAGAGQDWDDQQDRYKIEMDLLGDEAEEIHHKTKKEVELAWLKQLEIQ